jgi:hypothetical protein
MRDVVTYWLMRIAGACKPRQQLRQVLRKLTQLLPNKHQQGHTQHCCDF